MSTLPAANSIVHCKTCKDKWNHFDICICIICQGTVFKWRHLTTPLVLIPLMFSVLFFLDFLDFSHDLSTFVSSVMKKMMMMMMTPPARHCVKEPSLPYLPREGCKTRPGSFGRFSSFYPISHFYGDRPS